MNIPPLGKSYHAPLVRCPFCNHKLDGATAVGRDRGGPTAGSLTVCIECTNWLVYQGDFSLRPITEDEIAALPQEALNTLSFASKTIAYLHYKENFCGPPKPIRRRRW